MTHYITQYIYMKKNRYIYANYHQVVCHCYHFDITIIIAQVISRIINFNVIVTVLTLMVTKAMTMMVVVIIMLIILLTIIISVIRIMYIVFSFGPVCTYQINYHDCDYSMVMVMKITTATIIMTVIMTMITFFLAEVGLSGWVFFAVVPIFILVCVPVLCITRRKRRTRRQGFAQTEVTCLVKSLCCPFQL